VQPGSVRLPRDQPATIWELHLGALPQALAPLAALLNQRRATRRPGLGEDHVDLKAPRPMCDVGLPLLRSPEEALVDTPFDVELVYVTLVLDLAPRDEDVGFIASLVPPCARPSPRPPVPPARTVATGRPSAYRRGSGHRCVCHPPSATILSRSDAVCQAAFNRQRKVSPYQERHFAVSRCSYQVEASEPGQAYQWRSVHAPTCRADQGKVESPMQRSHSNLNLGKPFDKSGPQRYNAPLMEETVKPLNRDRLSVLMAMILLGSVLFRFIEMPEQVWNLQPLGSPLEIRLTGTWLLIALMIGLVCTGTNLILHDHPHLEEHAGRPIYVYWILPGAVAALSAYLLAHATMWPLWIGGLFLVGVSISLTVSAEYTAVSPDDPGYPLARLALNVLAYLLAFTFFAIIYHTRSRSLVTATLTLLAAALLALDLLSVAEVQFGRVLLFAGIVGLVVGESTWALNYWQISAWAGGLFLLLVFYIVVNVAHQHLLERLSVSTLVEFAVVAIVVLVIILLGAP
jgi:hypothetical protein